MQIKRFEDIDSWKEARQLVVDVYHCLERCNDIGFKSQMQRAAVSIMSNIAEGFDRKSNKEFIQFLVISRASSSEVRSLAYAGLDLKYFDREQFEIVYHRCLTVSKLLNGFIRFLNQTDRKA
jgi:four helix bundle protein